MRRTTPHYGIQGPDALLLFFALLSLGLVALAALRSLRYFSPILLLLGATGIFILSSVSSYPYRSNLRDHILKLSPRGGSDTVLDVGTGRGLLAIGLAKLGCFAVGIDIWSSSDLVRNNPARALLNAQLEKVEIPLVTADALEMPFRERSFDLVVCCDMIHNIHSRRKAKKLISEIHRVLREGGKVVIADLNPFLGPFWTLSRWRDEVKKVGFEKIETGGFLLTTLISGEKS